MQTKKNIQNNPTRKIIPVDAENKPLGRLAVEVAVLLRGKNKPGFVHYKMWAILFWSKTLIK